MLPVQPPVLIRLPPCVVYCSPPSQSLGKLDLQRQRKWHRPIRNVDLVPILQHFANLLLEVPLGGLVQLFRRLEKQRTFRAGERGFLDLPTRDVSEAECKGVRQTYMS